SSRFSRLAKAAQSGAVVPPADIRYLKRAAAPNLGGDSATGRIVAHLQQLYESVAETLPDFRGETDVVMAKRGEIGLEDELEDSYAEGLKSSTKEFEDPNSFVTGRTRKKRRRKSVVVDPEKVPPREPRCHMVHLQAHENYRRHVRCVIRPGWYALLIWFVESLLGLADKNPMTEKYREHLKHYIPLLEKWGFGEGFLPAPNPVKLFAWNDNSGRLVKGGQDDRKDANRYAVRAAEAITLQAAAAAWARGVPWAKALDIATRAVAKADPKKRAMPKAFARGRGRR
ncbi:unnamed protein product, partial [Durusdinium trenchii]